MTLDYRQQELLAQWLPHAKLTADLSWGLVDSTVLHMAAGEQEIIVKAGGPDNTHIAREITAHRTAVPLLAERGWAPTLLHADRDARILVTTYIPGTLIDSGPLESDPAILRQAGEILAVLHGSDSKIDPTIERNLMKAALRWLDKPNGIDPIAAERARAVLSDYQPGPVTVVPSHGDYSGRNWLQTRSGTAVIDFGRYGHRRARQDLLRLFFRRWYDHPVEREHFLEGYGNTSAIEGHDWWIDVLREAVATAGWAHKVQDRSFECLGLRFIEIALTELERG